MNSNTTEIGKTIETHAKANGYNVVKEFCGHGTGLLLHMKPLVSYCGLICLYFHTYFVCIDPTLRE